MSKRTSLASWAAPIVLHTLRNSNFDKICDNVHGRVRTGCHLTDEQNVHISVRSVARALSIMMLYRSQ